MAKIHIHTKYSLLDSIIEPEKLVQIVKQQDGDNAALCVTEHGNLYSNVEIYKLCKKYGVKYLLGCEMYICEDVNEKSKDKKYNHLVVVAKNETGRINLNKLVTKSCHYKYYGKPRIDFDMLVTHKEGLIVCSACMAGEIQKSFLNNDHNTAKTIALKYKNIFGDDYYLEYQSHREPAQQKLNRMIVDLAKELDIDYIVTTDAHYLTPDEQKYHEIFVKIGTTRETGETYNDCYVQSDEEILNICKTTTSEENQIAIDNTNKIADKCNVELPLSDPIMPKVKIPSQFKTDIDYLKYLCAKGWKEKNIDSLPNRDEYRKRLNYEMNAIKKMGFEGYFLSVYSYCNATDRMGLGRGSAGGSLICDLSGITNIDPIEYGLYFERFIDVGALDLLEQGKITKKELKIPDVDTDFGCEAREQVYKYVVDMYGKDRVIAIGAFQYIKAKGAIKDIGRVLGIPFEVTNEMTSHFNDETIKQVLELGLLDEYKQQYSELFVYAEKLSGLPKSFSAHPCGRIICMNDLYYYNAADINDDGLVILQGDMHTVDDLGLIKVDFLGLRTIDVIYDTLAMIGKDYSYVDPHNINTKDAKVYDSFRNGNTGGIFQFESQGMKDTLKKIECKNINDLIVANALYRPGSMKFIDNYANRKKGTEEFEYLHKDLEPILKNSYGIIVFQEQLIEIGRLAKLSNPDELRKATAKKKAELLDKIKPELYNGLKNRGWTEEQLDKLWDMMIDFAKYSFNKSHAACYSLTAYICMYLKIYHTKEFMCAWINSVSDDINKVVSCIKEAQRMNVKIYRGKFNDCSSYTKLYKDGIMLGIKTIKHCNDTIAEELMTVYQRVKGKHFIEVLDEISKTSINSKQLNILIGLNFFSDYGKNKKLMAFTDIYNGIKNGGKTILPCIRECKKLSKDKLDLYERFGMTETLIKRYSEKETEKSYTGIDNVGLLKELFDKIPDREMNLTQRINFEKEYLGCIEFKNPKVPDTYYIVTEFKTYKDPCKPYVTLRRICDGEEIKTKVKYAPIFRSNPFALDSILKINGFTWEYKKKKVNDKWVTLDEREPILEKYERIK